jgi:hypothetical protein
MNEAAWVNTVTSFDNGVHRVAVEIGSHYFPRAFSF